MTTSVEGRSRRERLVLGVACIGSFAVIMDATIVSVALPDVRADLGFSPAGLPWVVNAYTLAFAGFLLLGGRCADIFGRRRIMVLGMGLFTAARVAAGFAWSPAPLLVARAVQGVGGALLMPVTLSALTSTFASPVGRARALATWSAVGAAGAAAGPVIGGLLTQWGGWRWVFFVVVPLGVAGILGALAVLPRPPASDGPRPRLDLVGAVLVTAGISVVVLAIMRSSVGTALVGLLLVGAFLVHQARWVAQPLLPLDVFRLRSVSSANVVMFLLGSGFFASPVLLSLYLQDVHGYPPLLAGVGYLPVGVAMFAGARSAGRVTVALGPRLATVLCCAIGAVGLAGTCVFIAAGASYVWSVLVAGVVFGFGTAAAFTPLTVAATSGVPPERGGLAAGVLNTVRQTSGAVGLAALSAVVTAVAAQAAGYAAAFGASAGCLAVACLVAAVIMPRR
ncbi:MFS transporter [Pseudonocardia acaciae]|uniref:MFS transporter n=1 Tax=Pseudonocardia acaciae TaxID=551276 RepID=UPI0005611D3A|nr:MFS transporter [Pseudonocardia acaciae]